MIKRIFPLPIIMLAIIFSGCHKNFYDQADYVGIWNGANGSIVTLNSDNTYSLTAQSVLVSSGKYTATKNLLNFYSTAGFCHDSLPAEYGYVVSVTTKSGTFTRNLTLFSSTDSCSARAAILPGKYIIPNHP